MIEAREHIPNFITGFEPKTVRVKDLRELLAVDWIVNWSASADFHRFSLSRDGHEPGVILLMAEMKASRYGPASFWVVAYLRGAEALALPTWRAPT